MFAICLPFWDTPIFIGYFALITPKSRRFSNFSSFHLIRYVMLHPLGFNGDETIDRQGITSFSVPRPWRGRHAERVANQRRRVSGHRIPPPLEAFPGLSNVADILSVTRQGRKRRGIPKGDSPLAHRFAAQSVVCYTFCPGWRGEGDAVRVAASSVRQENGRGSGSEGGHSRARFQKGTEGIPLVYRPSSRRSDSNSIIVKR